MKQPIPFARQVFAGKAPRAGRRLPTGLPALGVALTLAGCAAARVAPPLEPRPGWPEDWAIRFALRCQRSGEDPRVCVCLAGEIQRRWMPEEFREREPEGLAAELERCRARVAE